MESEAEDLAQDVFIKVNLSLPSFRGDAALSTWIYRIATNAALDKLRKSSFRFVLQSTSFDDSLKEEQFVENSSPGGEAAVSSESALIRKDMNGCIRNVVNLLPEDYRTVIVLSEMEELRNQEIADILGITIETVKIRLHRARARLRKELAHHCTFYRDERNEFVCTPRDAVQEPEK